MVSRMRKTSEKIAQGNAAQLLVASELNLRGWFAAVTLGNTPHVDVLCVDDKCMKLALIQVKSFLISEGACVIGRHAICEYPKKFVWVLVGFSECRGTIDAEFYIVPADVMTKEMKPRIKKWERRKTKEGESRKGKAVPKVRIDGRKNEFEYDVRQWKNRWDVLRAVLEAK